MEEKDQLEQNIRILREWYEKQPHLPKGISENYFQTFSQGCKSLEISKRKMDAFFSQRNDQIWFNDFERLVQRFKDEEGGDFFFLPGTTPDGWRVLMVTFALVDINQLQHQLELFRRMLSIELALYLWPSDIKFYMIFDMKNIGLKFFSSVDFASERNYIKFLQTSAPLKYKGGLLLNTSPLVEKGLNILKPFIKQKLLERTTFCSGTSKMAEMFPRSMVPNEYGGEAGSIKDLGGRWRKEMLAHEDWFRENSRLRSDESKRPKDSAQSLDCGTFRTLSID